MTEEVQQNSKYILDEYYSQDSPVESEKLLFNFKIRIMYMSDRTWKEYTCKKPIIRFDKEQKKNVVKPCGFMSLTYSDALAHAEWHFHGGRIE
ncbi:MAG: hypothetical protein JRN26_05570 [Nitrososphaerota archaeon]|jgi:hypothetical protein|nr:hypothetical protein [Nitrososphaerota archaeon]MDG6927194.1 hypothetical protein [Nitrososphaerota archaeon]MDG6930818.1 hypothetical protein [Nitrososphaerota archaeon]MDG6932262.1 hypothetical protein [Nitrososphaerota archaeon]MDG6936333.1 hypothetical protein [Nitrososphaerota archaeon]